MVALATQGQVEPDVVGVGTRAQTAIDDVIQNHFRTHPFSTGVNRENAPKVMAEYAAMSEAFPHLQAGAQRPLIVDAIRRRRPVAEDRAVTAAVGTFLASDEFGVKYVLARYGNEGLPKILDTGEHFHSSLLQEDTVRLFGKPVPPAYTDTTGMYLLRLLDDLSDLDPVRRCAAMVAFERHAGHMIESLWESLARLFPVSKDELVYFKVHVGGDDPAEPYHVAMTGRMIERLIPAARFDEFVSAFEIAYDLNYSWCRNICTAR